MRQGRGKVVSVCGRYQFSAEQADEILQIIQEIERKNGKGAFRGGEIRPTVKAPVLVAGKEGVEAELYTWGYRLPGSLLINARAETAGEKPTFRESVAKRRCVIPSTGFYEWDANRRKYFFTLPGEDALYMAGLYEIRDGQPCYCILTTAANESMREIHDRMPLILERDQIRPWLEDPERSVKYLRMTPARLKKEPVDGQMGLW